MARMIEERPADLLQKAAETGDRDAKVALAMTYLKGEGVESDPFRAEQILLEAANDGHVGAALHLAHLYCGNRVDRNKEINAHDAIAWYKKAAAAGNAEAQHSLGMIYFNGKIAPIDLVAAADWIEKAAHNDFPAAQFQLGVMYCDGKGVSKDLSKAVAWYDLAAQLGHPVAQYNLAVMLSKGQGCEADPVKAVQWFAQAADLGLAAAQVALGNAYLIGRAVSKDTSAAREWYEKAAKQGSEEAKRRLKLLQ